MNDKIDFLYFFLDKKCQKIQMSDSEEEIVIKKKIKVKKECTKECSDNDEKDDENRKKSMIKITKILSQVYELWKDLSKDLSEEDKDVLYQLSQNISPFQFKH